MLRALLSDQKNWDTNSDPRSKVTWDGTPCLEKTCYTNNTAKLAELMVLKVGMKMDCLENRSTTTRIAVNTEEGGKCSMKSIDMEFHGFSGTGSCCKVS